MVGIVHRDIEKKNRYYLIMHMCLLEACEPLCRHFENLKGELKKMLGMHKYMCVCICISVVDACKYGMFVWDIWIFLEVCVGGKLLCN